MASDSLISSRLCRVCFASQTLSFVSDDARKFGRSLAFSALLTNRARAAREMKRDGDSAAEATVKGRV